MKVSLLIGITILMTTRIAQAEEKSRREHIEWCDIWVTAAPKDDLPRVLLIGDSITKGYYSAVEGHLKGRAHLARLATSKCVADPFFRAEVELLLKQYHLNVIHFNNGLHGWAYSDEEYRAGLASFLKLLRELAPEARLIWANSTPCRKRENIEELAERTKTVQTRNRIAAKLVKEEGIPINDLYALVIDHPEYHGGDGVHFNAKGREVQGKRVAEMILTQLEAQK